MITKKQLQESVSFLRHKGFEDPFNATGTDEEKKAVYRKVRDLIKETFTELFKK